MRCTLLVLLATSAAWGAERASTPPAGAERLAVVGLGRCEAPLAENVRGLRAALALQVGDRILSEQATAQVGGGTGRLSNDEVRERIEAGKASFLNLNLKDSERILGEVIPQVEFLPLGPERWEAFWLSRVELARLLRYGDPRSSRAVELFLEILRVQEDFQISRIEYPPSMREMLEFARSVLAGAPHFKLKVTSRETGATVYLNGYKVGRTPLELRLADGGYDVVVGEPKHHSFVHRVNLAADAALDVQLAQEAGLRVNCGPSLEVPEDRPSQLATAAAVAAALKVEQVAAVHLEHQSQADFLSVVAVEAKGGRVLREARLPLEKGAPVALDRLARFLLTGEGLEEPKALEPAPQPKAAPVPAPLEATSGVPEPPPAKRHRWVGPAAWSTAAVAAILGGLAVWQHLHAGDLESTLGEHQVPGMPGVFYPDFKERAPQMQGDLSSARRWRTGLFVGAGVAAVGAGALFYVDLRHNSARPGSGARTDVAVTFGDSF